VKIEWATICAEVRQHGATADLVDALADTYEISAALPIEVAPTVALIIQAEIDELSEGGVVAAVYVVRNPSQAIVKQGRADFAYPPPEVTVPTLIETRAAFPVPVTFTIAEYGAYEIGITIGENAAWLLTCHAVPR
jgi:hypothetical protein